MQLCRGQKCINRITEENQVSPSQCFSTPGEIFFHAPDPLTACVLQQLLGQIPGDTPVQILGPSGVATSALFLQRVDAAGYSFTLEIQREA